MMDNTYVYALEFKKAKWKTWSGLIIAESEQVAKNYISTFHPDMMLWHERYGNWYARRRLDDLTLITYRIIRKCLVTAEEVADIQARKEARRAKQDAQKKVIE